jgi:hypothetical protein
MSYPQVNHTINTDKWTMSEPINQSIGISINTITIGKPQQQQLSGLILATGEDNIKVREWQMYYNSKINDPFWDLGTRVRLIAFELAKLIESDVDTFNKICALHHDLVAVLCKFSK